MKTFSKVCKSIRRVKCQSGVKLLKEGLLSKSSRKAGGGRCQSPLTTFQFIYNTYCSKNAGRLYGQAGPICLNHLIKSTLVKSRLIAFLKRHHRTT